MCVYRDRATQEGDPIGRLVKGFGVQFKPTGANLGTLPDPRRPHALAHRHPGHQSLALHE